MASNYKKNSTFTFRGFSTNPEILSRQQRYYPYRQLLTRKYLKPFVSRYQALFSRRLLDFGLLDARGFSSDFRYVEDIFEDSLYSLLMTPPLTPYGVIWRMLEGLKERELDSLFHDPSEETGTQALCERFVLHELRLAVAFTSFVNYGRNIFEFPLALSSAFKDADTEIESIPLVDVKLPFRSFYLHFGETDYQISGNVKRTVDSLSALAALSQRPGFSPMMERQGFQDYFSEVESLQSQSTKYYLEGVYVQELSEGGFEIALIAASPTNSTNSNWVDYPTEALFVRIPLIRPDITVGEALRWEQAEIKKERQHLLSRQLASSSPAKDDLTDYFDDLTTQKELTYVDFFLGVLKLIVNSLFYVSNYRSTEEIDTLPVSTTSDPLFDSAPFSSKTKPGSNSKNKDYTTIKICGRSSCKTGNFSTEAMENVDNSPDLQGDKHKGDFVTHHRRRHYRLARTGKNWSEEKLVWVEWCQITGTLPEKPGLRIYQVSSRDVNIPDGNAHGKTVLDNLQITELREMFATGVATPEELAAYWNLPLEIIERILSRRVS